MAGFFNPSIATAVCSAHNNKDCLSAMTAEHDALGVIFKQNLMIWLLCVAILIP
jgi:hypothetical protein